MNIPERCKQILFFFGNYIQLDPIEIKSYLIRFIVKGFVEDPQTEG